MWVIRDNNNMSVKTTESIEKPSRIGLNRKKKKDYARKKR